MKSSDQTELLRSLRSEQYEKANLSTRIYSLRSAHPAHRASFFLVLLSCREAFSLRLVFSISYLELLNWSSIPNPRLSSSTVLYIG